MHNDTSDAVLDPADPHYEDVAEDFPENDLFEEAPPDEADEEFSGRQPALEAEVAESTSGESEQRFAVPLVDVQVPVTFDIGESLINIRQLESLMAGYTFELSTTIHTPVSIKVFGQLIARGQFLQVGDRLGVRILEIHNHGTV